MGPISAAWKSSYPHGCPHRQWLHLEGPQLFERRIAPFCGRLEPGRELAVDAPAQAKAHDIVDQCFIDCAEELAGGERHKELQGQERGEMGGSRGSQREARNPL